jgi:hypothetical protein
MITEAQKCKTSQVLQIFMLMEAQVDKAHIVVSVMLMVIFSANALTYNLHQAWRISRLTLQGRGWEMRRSPQMLENPLLRDRILS